MISESGFLPGQPRIAQVPEYVRGRAAVAGDAGADVDYCRVPDRLGHAGQDTGAAGQLRQGVDHLGRRVGEDPAQGVELVGLDGVHETGEQALQHCPVHIRRALRSKDKAEAVMSADAGDLPQHLGGDHLVVVRRDQVELVDRQHRERDLLLPGEVLQVARDRGGDDAQVAEQQAPAVDVDEGARLQRAGPVEPAADVLAAGRGPSRAAAPDAACSPPPSSGTAPAPRSRRQGRRR